MTTDEQERPALGGGRVYRKVFAGSRRMNENRRRTPVSVVNEVVVVIRRGYGPHLMAPI